MSKPALQRARLLAQMGFFALFTVTPIFDLFRYDLTERHAYFLTMPWHLGIDELIAGTGDPKAAAVNIILFLFLPVLGTLALIIGVAWKWGRLYCGWLCPHFSVVETINRLMLFATGKHSVWDKKQTPPWEPDGTPMPRDWRYWFAVVPAAIGFAFAWAVVGLTYLMPPFQVYGGLLNLSLLRGEVIFLCAATTVLTLEFLFARHLFCRYGCAIGIFQSFAWIVNKKAMVVGFDRQRITDCANCMKGCGTAANTTLARQNLRSVRHAEPPPPSGSACDAVCPMRLKPRNVKRWMFACTQCGQCISACATTNRDNPDGQLLRWVSNDAARRNEAGFSALSNTDEDAGGKI
ncbi:4Fe-4S binding protein [Dechloromonas sp. CZR5]|uniref:4Fe-4S binding protein n=1 Tax=Dechloromonas sp. CZR5 TaxID=2608630 RepID=UPI00123D1B0A|nr:4Fe-4S binding protein [Dechloromonas sp. CZR5]